MQAVDKLKTHLRLLPHPEGGYYKETYRSESSCLINGKERSCSTAIYFLLEKGNFSAFHRIRSDELWHFYSGDPREVIEIGKDGVLKITVLGNRIEKGELPQHVVKGGTWFASRVKKGGEYSFVGCTVAPGFDFQDFEMAERRQLISEWPMHAAIIEALTRTGK